METKRSLPFSQKQATFPFVEPDESSLRPAILLLKIHFNIILHRSSKVVSFFQVSKPKNSLYVNFLSTHTNCLFCWSHPTAFDDHIWQRVQIMKISICSFIHLLNNYSLLQPNIPIIWRKITYGGYKDRQAAQEHSGNHSFKSLHRDTRLQETRTSPNLMSFQNLKFV